MELTDIHTLHYHWVKGHAENEYNNRCDEMAVAESRKYKYFSGVALVCPKGAPARRRPGVRRSRTLPPGGLIPPAAEPIKQGSHPASRMGNHAKMNIITVVMKWRWRRAGNISNFSGVALVCPKGGTGAAPSRKPAEPDPAAGRIDSARSGTNK